MNIITSDRPGFLGKDALFLFRYFKVLMNRLKYLSLKIINNMI